jgi:hypothetical protein
LIIGSIFFKDIKVKEKLKLELIKQLEEQILEDGMHFELSPMYHKIILEDLIKTTYWLKGDSIYNQLIIYIQKMIDVTHSLEEGFGKTPAFNDSADGISKNYKSLIETCKKYFKLTPQSRSKLEYSGYYIIEDKYKKLIFDTGNICPAYLPAHGHCDALSFELSLDSVPVIVNSGTYMYENGIWRDYFRSTKAHNTISISDSEQSQCWGSFRVARRINETERKQFEYRDMQFYSGAYASCNGSKHKRFIGYIDENKIIVLDYLKAKSEDNIKSYIHFVPGAQISIKSNTVQVILNTKSFKITAIGTSQLELKKGWYSDKFSQKQQNEVLVFKRDRLEGPLGYLMDFNPDNSEIIETQKELKITGDKEFTINFDELGHKL